MSSESKREPKASEHRHVHLTVAAVTQQSGVPYTTSQVCCATCGAALTDRRSRRAAA